MGRTDVPPGDLTVIPLPDQFSPPGLQDPVGLLLSRDLIFTSKITGTAQELGYTIKTVGRFDLALSMVEQWTPRVVFVDLSAGDLVAPDTLAMYRRHAIGSTFIAFGPHVDREALDMATVSGCEIVMPRSRFVNRLPELIRRYLGTTSEA